MRHYRRLPLNQIPELTLYPLPDHWILPCCARTYTIRRVRLRGDQVCSQGSNRHHSKIPVDFKICITNDTDNIQDEATGKTHHLVAGDWAFFHVGSKAQVSSLYSNQPVYTCWPIYSSQQRLRVLLSTLSPDQWTTATLTLLAARRALQSCKSQCYHSLLDKP